MAETEPRCQLETMLVFLSLWMRDVFKTFSELNDGSERVSFRRLLCYAGFSSILGPLQFPSSLGTIECPLIDFEMLAAIYKTKTSMHLSKT